METNLAPLDPATQSRIYGSTMARLAYEKVKLGEAVAEAKVDAIDDRQTSGVASRKLGQSQETSPLKLSPQAFWYE